jgi:hypothetical protein
MIFGMFGSKKTPSNQEAEAEPSAVVPATAPVSAPAPAPTPETSVKAEAVQEVPKVILQMNEQDVVAAYKLFLRRTPENKTVVESRIGLPRERMLVNFITAKEFIKYPENISLILQTAQAIDTQAGVSQEVTP